MPVPTSIAELSTTISINSPQGTESAKGTIDDYLRAHAAFIRQTSDLVLGATVTLPSASTVAIGFAASSNIAITGTTTINAFDTYAEGALRYVTFSGAMTLVNSAVMALPTAANITTVSGDSALFKSLGGGNWKCLIYQRLSGLTLTQASASANGYLTAADWNTFNGKAPLVSPIFASTVTIATLEAIRIVHDTGYISAFNSANNARTGYIQFNAATETVFAVDVAQALAFRTSATERMRISPGGNLLVGTAADNGTHKLQVNGPITATSYTGSGANLTGLTATQVNTALGYTAQASLGFTPYNSTNPSGYISSITSGNVTTALGFTPANAAGQAFTGNISAPVVTQTSNERKKKNWQRLPADFIEKFASIKKAGLFQWRKGGAHCVGVGAQSLEVIMPAAVHTDEKGDKSVNTGGAALAIAHELSREVVRLRARLEHLERAK